MKLVTKYQISAINSCCEKCNGPNGIRSWDLSQAIALPTELKEIFTKTVNRGGHEPNTVPMAFREGSVPVTHVKSFILSFKCYFYRAVEISFLSQTIGLADVDNVSDLSNICRTYIFFTTSTELHIYWLNP